MNNWIAYPVKLIGDTVDLISLEAQHVDELVALAKDKRIWEFYTFDGSNPDKFIAAFREALIEQQNGNQCPFVIVHKQQQKLIGSTRLLDIKTIHRKLEIGWTWLHPNYWATAINLECKLLLLTYCFEKLQAVRVQLKTDENNMRSRKAIEK